MLIPALALLYVLIVYFLLDVLSKGKSEEESI